ncbi:hypothetical protein [Niveispirillum lacus]|uniref:hypothetical protein n=1 Tax=Niveispirillum lacus TaxID=1981099 RepID=UPI0013FDBAD2|nr:hypothetical protein [Niveispirillum lacus]
MTMAAASHGNFVPVHMDKRGGRSVPRWLFPVALALLLPFIGFVASWPMQGGWLDSAMADRWTRALLATADVGAFRDLTGTAYPVLPLAFDMIIALIPGLGGMPPPLLVNVLMLAIAAAFWVRLLVAGGYRFLPSLVTAALLSSAPALAPTVAAGGSAPLGVLAFTVAVSAAQRLARRGEVNDMIALGVSLAFLALADAAGAYLVLASVPFIALLLPARMVATSASGSLLVVMFPLIFAAIALFYANWVFGGSPLAFAAGVDAAIHGSAAQIGDSPWLLGPGGSIGTALVFGVLLILANAPLLAMGLWFGDRGARRVLLLLTGMILTALVLSSATWFLGDPGRLLAYLAPVCVLAAAVAGRHQRRGGLLMLLVLLGLVAGWWAQDQTGDAHASAWRLALLGQGPVEGSTKGDLALGHFLRDLNDVAIDGLTAGAVLPGRGRAAGLVLPSNDRLKADLIVGQLRTAYVALRAPARPAGARDRIAQALPDLWQDAGRGAVLVYDRDDWRVWRLPAGERNGGE